MRTLWDWRQAEECSKEPVGRRTSAVVYCAGFDTESQTGFLDELTTGLDAKARRTVWKILEDLKKQGLTIFLTSHFMDEVEALCDEICILKKGEPVFYGTVEQAKSESGCKKFEDAYLKFSDDEEGIGA